MSCNCHTLTTHARARGYDPTHTTSLRNAFAREFGKRFRRLRGLIRQAIVERDVFGMQGQMNEAMPRVLVQQGLPQPRAFDFPRSREKVSAFMDWLKAEVDREMLTTVEMRQLGQAIETEWTDKYVLDSYKRGVQRSAYELKKAGYSIPSIEERGGIDAVMGGPAHVDRVGVLYTRVFEELKGITSQMDTQISRVLSQGMIDGDGPQLLARKLNATISGKAMGDLGLTDTLGRFIPAERRAKLLARTEIIRAHHKGMMQEYRNWRLEGVRVRAELVSAQDDRVCSECLDWEAATANTPMSLEEAENLVPIHPQCRCVVIPTGQMNR